MKNTVKLEPLIIFSFSLCLFILGLNNQEFIGFETRFALFAKEMLQNGFSFFPTTYHQPYPDYPVTSTFLIFLIAKLTGQFTKLIAVLPSAIAAAITVATTYAIGALQDRRLGIFAALLLLLTGTFFTEARTISLDQYSAATTCLGFYVVYSADVLQKPQRLWFIPILLILGFAFRGPIGLIIPTSVLIVYYLLDKNYKNGFILGFLACVLLVICSAGLVFLAKQTAGTPFAHDVLKMQSFSRFGNDDHDPKFYYYFIKGWLAYAVTLPLSLLVLVGICRTSNSYSKLIIKLIAWVLIILIGMSIPGDKKMRYVLAISPALALISAYLFIAPQENKYFATLYRIFYRFCFYSPSIGLLASFGIMAFTHLKAITVSFNLLVISLGFIGLQLANLFLKKDFYIVSCTVLSFAILSIFCIEPLNLSINQTRDFVLQLEQMRSQQQAQLAFYQENRDGLPIKYVVNAPKIETPLFITSAKALSQVKTKTFFIAGKEEFSQIPAQDLKRFQIITYNIIGRKPVVVFTQKQSSPTDLATVSNLPVK